VRSADGAVDQLGCASLSAIASLASGAGAIRSGQAHLLIGDFQIWTPDPVGWIGRSPKLWGSVGVSSSSRMSLSDGDRSTHRSREWLNPAI
jgi:hypothetical protein